MNPELLAYAAEAMALLPNGLAAPPPSSPAPGQSRDEWVAEVAKVRAEHDAQARVLADHITPAGPEVAGVSDVEIAVDGGWITARVYTPAGDGPFPAIVFFHGGAFWLGGGENGFGMTDAYCREFAVGTGSVFVNVDYRLAPECAFPQQPEDCFAGLQYLVSHAADLNVDPSNVSVMGASSGGNQAAAVCLLAQRRGGPVIRALVLHVPVLDLTLSSESARTDLAFASLDDLLRLYVSDDDRTEPLASPLSADDAELASVPPCVVVIGDFDGLRDDGRRWTERLQRLGVPTTLLTYPMFHSVALPDTTRQMVDEMAAALRTLQQS